MGQWVTEMSPAERSVFESVAGDELHLAGYGLSAAPRRLRLRERVSWRIQDVAHWLVWRSTTWDRGPRARTTVILIRARIARLLRPGALADRRRCDYI